MRRLLLIFLLLPLLLTGVAQVRTGPISGSVYEEITEAGYRRQALIGAVVEVQSPSDTLHTTTDYNGNFHLRAVPAGKVRVKVTYLGYKPFVQDSVHIAARYGIARLLRVRMEVESTHIDDVVVTGTPDLVTQRGDTLVFNALAVRTMAGDETAQLLEQLPGVTVDDDGGVTIQGEKLARVYVNGRMLFGEDPKAAIQTLLAKDVMRLELYDEDVDDDRTAGRKQAEKQRVMNIRTKRDIASLFDGYLLGSVGADLAEDSEGHRQQRYGVGLTATLFSEKFRVGFDGYSNNIGRRSNRLRDVLRNNISSGRYTESNYANLFLSKTWGKNRREGQTLELAYSYTENYTRSSSGSLRNYFATEASPARLYADSTSSSSAGGTHSVKLYALVHPHGKHQLSSRNEFSYSSPRSHSEQQSLIESEELLQRSEVLEQQDGTSYTIKNNLNWVWNTPKVVRPYMSLNSTVSRTERAGWRVDTLTNEKRVLETDYIGPRESYNAEFSLQRDIYETDGMRMELFASYQWDYEHSRTRQTALNTYEPVVEIDPTNTYNYTYDYTTHSGRVAYRINSSLYRLAAIVDVKSASMNKDEFYPEAIAYDERFVSVLPSFTFTLMRHGRRINLLNYSTSATLPSVEQLRDRIDNSNLLLLQAGNPALRQSIRHTIALHYPGNVNAATGRNIELGLQANFHTRRIAQRSYYFADATYLEKWDYTAPAGSTLYTYENIDGSFDVSGNFAYARRIESLKSTLRLALRYNYSQQAAYIGDKENVSRRHLPSLSLSLGGTQSRNLRLHISSTTTYSTVDNSIGSRIEYLNESASASAEVRFLKYLMFNASYRINHTHYLTDSGIDNTNQTLNALIGFTGKGGMWMVSLAAYDLLNRGSSYTTTTYADYEQQSWQPSYGRYFTINVGLRLNRSSKNAPGSRQFDSRLR